MGERFPFPDNPTGWFRVAFADEVRVGEIASLQYFGRHLVAFRTEDGAVHVTDAHCPHLGAHLGVGGRIEDRCIVCPFHGWKFDTDGRNVDIPYRDEVNRKASLATLPATEWCNLVMVWFDEAGGAPSWQLPDLAEMSDGSLLWHAPPQARWRIKTHPQEVLENTVDIAHFRFVHGVSSFGAMTSVEDGPMRMTTAELALTTPRGPVAGFVQNEMWGLGVDINRVIGIGKGATIVTLTPIDGVYTEVAYAFLSARAATGDGISRAAQGHVADNIAQIEADFPIWENKVHRVTPALAIGEGPIMDFRRWAARFYPPGPDGT